VKARQPRRKLNQTMSQPRFACESFSLEKGNARESPGMREMNIGTITRARDGTGSRRIELGQVASPASASRCLYGHTHIEVAERLSAALRKRQLDWLIFCEVPEWEFTTVYLTFAPWYSWHFWFVPVQWPTANRESLG